MGKETNSYRLLSRKKLALVVGGSVVLGIIIALVVIFGEDQLLYWSQVFRYGYVYTAPVIYIAFAISMIAAIMVFYTNAKRKRYLADLSRPEEKKALGREISKAQTLLSVMNILSCFFFGTILTMGFDFYISDFFFYAVLSFITMIGILVFSGIIQKHLLEEIAIIDNLDKEEVFGSGTSDKWIDNLKEKDQLIIYESGYYAYKMTSKFCAVLWAALVICGIVFDIGFWPVAAVTSIWLFSTLCYIHQAKELTE